MAKRVSVRFNKPHSPYNSGEVAGFLPERAAALVGSGAASFLKGAVVKGAGKPAKAEKPPKPPKGKPDKPAAK